MYLQMMQQASLLRPACCTSWAWARAGCSSPRATPVHFESQEARVSFRDSSGRRWPLHTPVAPSARMGFRIRLTHAPQPAYEYAPSHSAVSRRVPPTRRALDGACPPFSAKDPLSNSWEMVTSPKDPLNSAYLSERPIHAVGCTSQYLGHVRGDDAARFSAQTRRRRVFPHHRRGAERVQAQPPLTCRGGVLVGSLRTHRGGRARPRPCGTPPRVRGAQHSAPQRKRRVRAAAHGGCERVPSSVRTSG